jgi:hypothetical protein
LRADPRLRWEAPNISLFFSINPRFLPGRAPGEMAAHPLDIRMKYYKFYT